MEEPTTLQVWYAVALTVGGYVLTLIYIPRVLSRRTEPGATLAWLLMIILFPYLGVGFYILLGGNRIRIRTEDKLRANEHIERFVVEIRDGQEAPEVGLIEGVDPDLANVIRNLNLWMPTGGNKVDVSVDGAESFDKMEALIDSARHHVHMQFFIFKSDRTGTRMRDALIRAARRGVQVRLLIDSVGSYLTSERFFKPLRAVGGEVARFLPVGPLKGWAVYNLRNHRKLMVIDGIHGCVGGINVGDAYAGLQSKFGEPWRDTWLGVSGPAAAELQEVFAGDWYFATGKVLVEPLHFPPPHSMGLEYVQIVPSAPAQQFSRLHQLIVAMVHSARERLYITTPYFVPDPTLAAAVNLAALRGVEVRLLVPKRSNHPLADLVGRSFYQELLDAGVMIHEYQPSMLHAKGIVIDGALASLGSANMDMRSFRLSFEVNAHVFGREFASQLEELFVKDTLASTRVDPKAFAARSAWKKSAESVARILSPVV